MKDEIIADMLRDPEVQELLKKGRNADRMMAICAPLLILSVAAAAFWFFFKVFPYLLGE